MHFFNPVHKMPLVEVIRGEKTSDQTVASIYQLSKTLGKTPIVVKDMPGFLVNRLLLPYLNEATWLLGDGASIPELDEALLEFGMPMGPMELIDEVGVDVGDKVSHILREAFGPRMEPSPYNAKVVESGRLGKKNGKGFYQYDAQGRNREFNSEIYSIIGVTPREGSVSAEEMVDRCILPMINEAARCLDDRIVETAAEVDLGMIMGTGFPPFRGGLMRYADSLGPRAIVEKLRMYEKRLGVRYEPASRLLKNAEVGKLFYE
jgi:3-hydroxyacyl-CoA dehydrogenase/enoyl-CoA hydratase/3-hydroxybutyryl-CoA epimerase